MSKDHNVTSRRHATASRRHATASRHGVTAPRHGFTGQPQILDYHRLAWPKKKASVLIQCVLISKCVMSLCWDPRTNLSQILCYLRFAWHEETWGNNTCDFTAFWFQSVRFQCVQIPGQPRDNPGTLPRGQWFWSMPRNPYGEPPSCCYFDVFVSR